MRVFCLALIVDSSHPVVILQPDNELALYKLYDTGKHKSGHLSEQRCDQSLNLPGFLLNFQ